MILRDNDDVVEGAKAEVKRAAVDRVVASIAMSRRMMIFLMMIKGFREEIGYDGLVMTIKLTLCSKR